MNLSPVSTPRSFLLNCLFASLAAIFSPKASISPISVLFSARKDVELGFINLCLGLALSLGVLCFTGLNLGLAIPLAVPIGFAVSRAPTQITLRLVFAELCFVPIFFTAMQFAHFWNGSQGIDFAIFSQTIHQVAESNRFISSLIATSWQNFFTHHLSAYLYLLGLVSRVGISEGVVLILAHGLSVTALTIGIFKLFGSFSTDYRSRTLFTIAALFLPTLRTTLAWETHDEVLALPLLVWSLHAHFSGKHRLKLLILLPGLFFKETFGLNMFALAGAYALLEKRSRAFAISVAMLGFAVFILYTKVFPRWLWFPTFDGSTRISSLSQFFDLNILGSKLLWLLKILAPALPFLLLHSRTSLKNSATIFSAVAYNFGAIAVTNFAPMYETSDYYSIIPAVGVFLAIAAPVLTHRNIFRCLALSFSIISLIGGQVATRQLVGDGFLKPSARSEIQSRVPSDKVVIADDGSANNFTSNTQVVRIFHANRMILKFDFIVYERGRTPHLSRYLRSWSRICAQTRRHQIRCAFPRVRAKRIKT